jgi:ribonucleoside-diphosphate reductase alpha chain
MLKGDERAEKENEAKSRKEDKVEQVATPHRVYPRPKKLHGVTVNTQTPFGTAYITMNSDEQGYPFEVFITAPGKAGSDLQADAEGLGRMISLSLRTTEPHNRREMLRLIIDQLRDIGGARSIGFGIERVISLPDAVARALEDHYFPKSETLQLQIPMMDVGIGKSSSQPKLLSSNGHDRHHEIEVNYSTADLCPSCGTISLVRAEGCRRCLTCDYTEC